MIYGFIFLYYTTDFGNSQYEENIIKLDGALNFIELTKINLIFKKNLIS